MKEPIDALTLRSFAQTLRELASRCDTVASLAVIMEGGEQIVTEFARIFAQLAHEGKITDLRVLMNDNQHRTVVRLVEEGMSTTQLGGILNCSPQAAQQYLHRRNLTVQTIRDKERSNEVA